MPTLAELRAQLAAEGQKSAAQHGAIQREMQRRAARSQDRDVFAKATEDQQRRFTELHSTFARGASLVTADSVVEVAQERFGVELTRRSTGEALRKFSRGTDAESGLDVAAFARFWTLSRDTPAVALRAAEVVAAAKEDWRACKGSSAIATAAPWRPVTSVNANVTVGDVGDEFKAESGIRLAVLPSTADDFADEIAAALETVRGGISAEDEDGDEMAPITADSIAAVATIRIPIVGSPEDDAVLECVELLRGAAEEFNAQDEFPVAVKIAIVDSDANGREFHLFIFVRNPSQDACEDGHPIATFQMQRFLFAALSLVSAAEPLIEKLLVGVDFGFDASQLFSINSPFPLSKLVDALRVSVAGAVTDAGVAMAAHMMTDADAFDRNNFQRVVNRTLPAQLLLNTLHSGNVTMHFDTVTNAVDSLLDEFVEAHVAQAVASGTTDPVKLQRVRDECEAAATVMRSYFTKMMPLEARASDALGIRALTKVFGTVKRAPRMTIVGGTAESRGWALHCLQHPEAFNAAFDAAAAAAYTEHTGPFALTIDGNQWLGFSFTDEQAHRAAASEADSLVALVDTTDDDATGRDVRVLHRLLHRQKISRSFSDTVLVIATGESKKSPADIGTVRKAVGSKRSIVGVFDNDSVEKGQEFLRQLHAARSLTKAKRGLADDDSMSDDDDDSEGSESTANEIIQTLVFAFRKHVRGIASASFVTAEIDATLKLRNIDLLSLIPETRETMATARSEALASLRTQTKAYATNNAQGDSDGGSDASDDSDAAGDFGAMKQQSSVYDAATLTATLQRERKSKPSAAGRRGRSKVASSSASACSDSSDAGPRTHSAKAAKPKPQRRLSACESSGSDSTDAAEERRTQQRLHRNPAGSASSECSDSSA